MSAAKPAASQPQQSSTSYHLNTVNSLTNATIPHLQTQAVPPVANRNVRRLLSSATPTTTGPTRNGQSSSGSPVVRIRKGAAGTDDSSTQINDSLNGRARGAASAPSATLAPSFDAPVPMSRKNSSMNVTHSPRRSIDESSQLGGGGSIGIDEVALLAPIVTLKMHWDALLLVHQSGAETIYNGRISANTVLLRTSVAMAFHHIDTVLLNSVLVTVQDGNLKESLRQALDIWKRSGPDVGTALSEHINAIRSIIEARRAMTINTPIVQRTVLSSLWGLIMRRSAHSAGRFLLFGVIALAQVGLLIANVASGSQAQVIVSIILFALWVLMFFMFSIVVQQSSVHHHINLLRQFLAPDVEWLEPDDIASVTPLISNYRRSFFKLPDAFPSEALNTSVGVSVEISANPLNGSNFSTHHHHAPGAGGSSSGSGGAMPSMHSNNNKSNTLGPFGVSENIPVATVLSSQMATRVRMCLPVVAFAHGAVVDNQDGGLNVGGGGGAVVQREERFDGDSLRGSAKNISGSNPHGGAVIAHHSSATYSPGHVGLIIPGGPAMAPLPVLDMIKQKKMVLLCDADLIGKYCPMVVVDRERNEIVTITETALEILASNAAQLVGTKVSHLFTCEYVGPPKSQQSCRQVVLHLPHGKPPIHAVQCQAKKMLAPASNVNGGSGTRPPNEIVSATGSSMSWQQAFLMADSEVNPFGGSSASNVQQHAIAAASATALLLNAGTAGASNSSVAPQRRATRSEERVFIVYLLSERGDNGVTGQRRSLNEAPSLSDGLAASAFRSSSHAGAFSTNSLPLASSASSAHHNQQTSPPVISHKTSGGMLRMVDQLQDNSTQELFRRIIMSASPTADVRFALQFPPLSMESAPMMCMTSVCRKLVQHTNEEGSSVMVYFDCEVVDNDTDDEAVAGSSALPPQSKSASSSTAAAAGAGRFEGSVPDASSTTMEVRSPPGAAVDNSVIQPPAATASRTKSPIGGENMISFASSTSAHTAFDMSTTTAGAAASPVIFNSLPILLNPTPTPFVVPTPQTKREPLLTGGGGGGSGAPASPSSPHRARLVIRVTPQRIILSGSLTSSGNLVVNSRAFHEDLAAACEAVGGTYSFDERSKTSIICFGCIAMTTVSPFGLMGREGRRSSGTSGPPLDSMFLSTDTSKKLALPSVLTSAGINDAIADEMRLTGGGVGAGGGGGGLKSKSSMSSATDSVVGCSPTLTAAAARPVSVVLYSANRNDGDIEALKILFQYGCMVQRITDLDVLCKKIAYASTTMTSVGGAQLDGLPCDLFLCEWDVQNFLTVLPTTTSTPALASPTQTRKSEGGGGLDSTTSASSNAATALNYLKNFSMHNHATFVFSRAGCVGPTADAIQRSAILTTEWKDDASVLSVILPKLLLAIAKYQNTKGPLGGGGGGGGALGSGAVDPMLTNVRAPSYELGRRLGSGSFGDVFEVRLEISDGLLAMKRIFLHDGEEGKLLLEETRREVALMAALDHKNIVRLSHCTFEDRCVCLFMELCEYSLSQQLRRQPTATLSQATASITMSSLQLVHVVNDVVSGIAFLHQQGIVHRDLKPENILFRQGVAKISDLGTAVRERDSKPLLNMKGTLAYMAPEVLLGEPYGRPCDIWALGCILAEMIGVPLFHLYHASIPNLTRIYESMVDSLDLQEIPPGLLSQQQQALVTEASQDTATSTPTTTSANSSGSRLQLPGDVLALLRCCFARDPLKRISAEELLTHPVCYDEVWMAQMRLAVAEKIPKEIADCMNNGSVAGGAVTSGGGGVGGSGVMGQQALLQFASMDMSISSI